MKRPFKWMYILIATFALIANGCDTAKSAFLDVKIKHDYTFNKIIFLSAFLEKYKEQQGAYPEKLEVLEPTLNEYAAQHQAFMEKYLASPWQKRKIGWFFSATETPIWYLKDTESGSYYLYTSYGTFAAKALPPSLLDDVRLGRSRLGRSDIYLVYGGDLIWGPCRNVNEITLEKMPQILHPLVYRGHRVYF